MGMEPSGDMQKDLTYGIVDLGYYGTNQYYLQRLTNIKTKGYCFYACLSKDNVYMNDIFVIDSRVGHGSHDNVAFIGTCLECGLVYDFVA